MLLYRAVVMNAMTDVVEPALRKAVDRALTNHYGVEWFHTVGAEIMQTYTSYSDIENAVNGGIRAIDAMDIPAIIYLLKPKKNEEDEEEFEPENGVMSDVASFYGWDDRAVFRILRIRIIRNNCFHDKMDQKLQLSEQMIKSGNQEKLWLDDLEAALKLLDASGDLSIYKNELLGKILKQEKNNSDDPNTEFSVDSAVLSYIREGESIRSQYMRIHPFTFGEAPIKEAISGSAPWADAKDDLNSLAWPSEEVSRNGNGANVNMNHTSQNNAQNHAKSNTMDPESDAINKAVDSLDKGVSKLFNWLSKKK